MAMDLKLPAKVKLAITWKQIGLVGLVLFVVVAIVFLTISGQWKMIQNLFLKVRMKDRKIKIAKLQAQQEANEEKLKGEEELRKKLKEEEKRLEKEALETKLEIEGMSHDEIVDALRNRGF